MRRSRIAAIAALSVALGLSGTVFAQAAATPANAYDALDNQRLGLVLQSMGMGDMLEVLVAQLRESNPADAKRLNSYLQVMKANAPGISDEQREILFDMAVTDTKETVDNVAKAIDEKSTGDQYANYFMLMMRLAELQGILRVEPYTDRLSYLLGGESDKKLVAKHGAQAVETIDALLSKINYTLQKWRGGGSANFERMVDLPVIEEMVPMINYKSAWIRFYYCMGLPDDDPKKNEQLAKVTTVLDPFITDKESGVVEWSLLLRGRSFREKDEFEPAAADFDSVIASEKTAKPAKVLAIFENARNAIEYADFLFDRGIKAGKDGAGKPDLDKGKEQYKKADEATKAFPAAALEVAGAGGAIGVDLKWAVLHDYLYGRWAKSLLTVDPNDAEGKKIASQASEGMKTLLEKYPQAKKQILEIFQKMNGGKGLEESSNDPGMAIILITDVLAGKKEEIKANGKLQEAINTLAKIVENADKGDTVAQANKASALMNLGIAYNLNDNPIKSAEMFKRIVDECPDNKRNASLAAFRAVSIYNQLIRRWQQTNNNPDDAPLDYREALISCIESMLALWEASPTKEARAADFKQLLDLLPERERNLGVYYLDLGMNKEAMSRYTPSSLEEARKAIAAAKTQQATSGPATSRPTSGPAVAATSQPKPTSMPAAKSPAQWRKEAIEAYEKYPSDCPDYVLAQFNSLQLQYEPFADISEIEKKKSTAAATALLPKLDSFVAAVKKALEDNPGEIKKIEDAIEKAKKEQNTGHIDYLEATLKSLKEQPKLLMDWGSIMDYNGRVLEYEVLSKENSALEKIAAMPTVWPGTGILRYSREFEIRKLVDKGKVKEAIQKVRDFQKEYSSQEANDLISLVISKIRLRIRDLNLSSDAEKKKEKRQYVEAYREFAETLYTDGIEAGLDADKMYPLKQMYADSLLMKVEYVDDPNDKQKIYSDALKLFKECSEADAAKQKQTIKGVYDESKKQFAAAKKMEDSASMDQIKKAVEEFQAYRSKADTSMETGFETDLKIAVEQLGNVTADTTEATRKAKVVQAAQCLANCWSDLQGRAEATLKYLEDTNKPVNRAVIPTSSDANNVRGLARSYAALKNYKQAADYYRQLTRGLDPNKFKDMYWDAQTEYADCLYSLYEEQKKDPKFNYKESMSQLAMRLRQILADNKDNSDLKYYQDKLTLLLNDSEKASNTAPAATTKQTGGDATTAPAAEADATPAAEGSTPASAPAAETPAAPATPATETPAAPATPATETPAAPAAPAAESQPAMAPA